MADQLPTKAEWESSRVAEPIDFPAIVFQKYATMLATALGSTERHHHLQDLEDSLTGYADETYREQVKKAETVRNIILARSVEEDGKPKPFSVKEAVDVHQRMWHRAIVRLMTRKGLLGEEWVRG